MISTFFFTLFLILFWIFMLIGLYGLYRFKNFNEKILTTSKIDSVATLCFMVAMLIKCGWTLMSLKLLFVLFFFLITNPVINQLLAYSSIKKEDID